jgi:hypothetical protein
MLKNYILILTAVLIGHTATAQEIKEKKSRLTDSVEEVYHVLKANKNIKQGLYQAVFEEMIPVASGAFDNDLKVGTWRFFDKRGKLLQVYDYDKKKLAYEAPETQSSGLRYFADIDIDSTDVVTKPIKVGGRYYGYIPYLQLFKLPVDIWDLDRKLYTAAVELLISPLGRLAYYKVHIAGPYNYERIINMNINLPNEEDKSFIPAKKNGEPVACRIVIAARITARGHLDFASQ